MNGNVITANFRGGRTTMTTPLWQYDYGQVLRFTGVSLPETYEVHFSNAKRRGDAKTAIGDANGVEIPDEFLATGDNVYAWIFLHATQEDGETEYMATIPVNKRATPSDEAPTPQEQSAITQAIAALNSAVVDVQEAVDAAESARVSATNAASSATAAAASEAGVEADADRASNAATAAESAQTAAEAAQAGAETAQTGAESARDEAAAASTAQITAIANKGAEVLESIPADYTELSGDVSNLKSDLNATEIVDLGNRALQQGFLTNDAINYTAGAYFCIIDISKFSKVSITAGTMAAYYGFLRSFTYGSPVDFSTATGFTSRLYVSAGYTANHNKPNDVNYLYIQMENLGSSIAPSKVTIDGYDIATSALLNITSIKKDVSDLQTADTELLEKHTVLQNRLNGTETVLLKDRQLYKGFLTADTINYNTNAYFATIDVVDGQKMTIGAGATAVNIAVLKSFTYGEAPVFSEAEGFTGRLSIPVNQTREYTIPSDGKYLLVMMENLGSSIAPISVCLGKYDICKNVPVNYNDLFPEFDYKASVKKPTNFTYQTQNEVVFSVDAIGNQSVVGTPTASMAWYSASFLQKENAKAILTGKPSGSGSKYWVRLQESSDGETFTLVDSDNQTNSNDSHFNLEAGKYYRLMFGITSNAVGSPLNLSFKAVLFAGGYVEETNHDAEEEDGLTDIIIPHIVDTMEGHETNIYFDTLSKYDGMENQYSLEGITHGMYRNEFCTRFTPTASDSTFYLNAVRYDKETAKEKERKRVYFNVNHPLQSNLTKNVLIMGDSLTDADIVPQECYRMLTADADCIINHIGTLGETGSENEGRSGWQWFDYISPSGTRMTNYDNPFWDETNNRLDFKKYCQTNGYSGLDYVLINLGTNDAMPMTIVDSPEGYAEVLERAKTFLTALLSEDYGYPNCKVAIALLGIGPYYSARIFENANEFRKKFNMLNVAYLYTFDNGAWHPNVTCFALGSSTNRKYGYGYTETAISSRFSQLTIQEDDGGIHPSTAGYQSWADAYYCKIRTWLTEDSQ